VVKNDGTPFTEEDYNDKIMSYDEFVLEQEAQIVPIFLLVVDPKSIASIHSQFQRNLPPTTLPSKYESRFKTPQKEEITIPLLDTVIN